ncbi:hypothetical protein ACIF8T_27405 [Streptomyces sp. NPDC085946]|uniref:hypothetical protein n=1 Tax=Streptomyces sp. NPDC085946 TaxID=3365744 RepID=UPI0037CF7C6D
MTAVSSTSLQVETALDATRAHSRIGFTRFRRAAERATAGMAAAGTEEGPCWTSGAPFT